LRLRADGEGSDSNHVAANVDQIEIGSDFAAAGGAGVGAASGEGTGPVGAFSGVAGGDGGTGAIGAGAADGLVAVAGCGFNWKRYSWAKVWKI
jgi:hypothetical protein